MDRRFVPRLRARRWVVVLACACTAPALAMGARSASDRAPSFADSLWGDDGGELVATGDLNGDGRADIVAANSSLARLFDLVVSRGGKR